VFPNTFLKLFFTMHFNGKIDIMAKKLEIYGFNKKALALLNS
jgi:hypothetical protein